jgi:hypothetical protein
MCQVEEPAVFDLGRVRASRRRIRPVLLGYLFTTNDTNMMTISPAQMMSPICSKQNFRKRPGRRGWLFMGFFLL